MCSVHMNERSSNMSSFFQFCILLVNANENINQHCVGTTFVHQLQLYVGTDMSLAKSSENFVRLNLLYGIYNTIECCIFYLLYIVFYIHASHQYHLL